MKFPGALHDDVDAVASPTDLGRVSRLPQDGDGDTVDEECSFLFIDNPDDSFRFEAVEEALDRSVGRILLDQLRNGGKPGPDVPPHIDDDFLEIFSSDMVPQRQLADSPEAVDAEYRTPVFKDLDPAHTHVSFVF
jgi:hypothetical protein